MSNVSLLGGCLPINTSSATVEEATTSHLWMIGVVLMLIGCLSSATGLLFMKQSSVMGEGKKPLCRRWRWITGFVLLVVNAIWIDIIAFSITPMALIAPFAGMTIVFTLLISATGCVTQREVPSRWDAAYLRVIPGGRDLSGILLVLVGVTLVSVFGPHGDGSPEALHFSFRSALLAAGVAGYIAAWLVLHCISTRRRRAAAPPPGGTLPPALSHRSRAARALSDEIAEESADAAAAGTAPPTAAIGGGAQASAVETIGTCLASAMCGMATQVALKQVSKVVVTSFLDLSHLGEAGWAEPITWAAFVLLPCSAPLQLWLLNKALAGAKVSYSVPAYQSLLIVMNLLAAGIFYDEFTCHPEVVPFVAGGILAVIAGLGVLSLTNRDAEGEANRDQRSTLLTDRRSELVASSTPGRLAPERSDSDEPPSLPVPPGQACLGAASTAPPLPSHVPVGVEVRSGEEGAGEERLSHPPHVTAEKARASMRQMASDLEAAFEDEGEEEARRPGTPVCGHSSSIRSSVDSLSLEAAEV